MHMKRITALLLTVVMLLSMLTIFIQAAGSEEEALGEIHIYNGGETLSCLAVNGRVQTLNYVYYQYPSTQGYTKEIPAYCVNPTDDGVPQKVGVGESIKYIAAERASEPQVMGIVANAFKKYVEEKSNGTVEVEIFYAGGLGEDEGVQFRKGNAIVVRGDAAGQAVAQHAGLLEDFLEHEVAVAALLGRLHVPLDGLDLARDGRKIFKPHDFVACRGCADNFAVFKKEHLARVGQKGGNVRGNEVFAGADAENERSGHARGIERIGFVLAHEADGIGAVGLPEGGGKGLKEIRRSLPALLNQIDENFGIRFGVEDIALAQQIVLDLLVVLDNAVMDNGNIAAVGGMGVGVAFGRDAVRCPAGMPHGRGRHGDGTQGQLFFQSGQFAQGPRDMQFVALHIGHARGIIAAILQTAQTFDNNRNCRTMSGITDNAAHGIVSLHV